jgi:hypothetical protein
MLQYSSVATRHGLTSLRASSLYLHDPSIRDIDTSKQFFSIGFGRMFVKNFFTTPSNGAEIISKDIHRGIYAELNFRDERFGFNTGLQYIDKEYYEKYPQGNPYALVGRKHSSGIRAHPLYLSYQVIKGHHVRLFLRAGFVCSKVHDYITSEYNYSPVYSRPESRVIWYISWSGGLNAEVNLLKKDLWLSTQLQYVAPPVDSIIRARVSCSLGLCFVLSNILYKDKIKTLQNYPIGKS